MMNDIVPNRGYFPEGTEFVHGVIFHQGDKVQINIFLDCLTLAFHLTVTNVFLFHSHLFPFLFPTHSIIAGTWLLVMRFCEIIYCNVDNFLAFSVNVSVYQ